MGLLIVVFGVWTFLLATGKNPLPFPDPGSRIYTAASPEGKDAIVELFVPPWHKRAVPGRQQRHSAVDHVGWNDH